MAKLKCPYCKKIGKMKVVPCKWNYKEIAPNVLQRKRKCEFCNRTFKTQEDFNYDKSGIREEV